jgi:ubiquinone/menaquinone biosynthesis C-methylase UbiE
MTNVIYPKSTKYKNLYKIYKGVSGPGGLKLAEFIADKMNIIPDHKFLDIGTSKGYQTCFLSKEYGLNIIGIDPWNGAVNDLMINAKEWQIDSNIIGIKLGLPNTLFADNTFDRIYCTTTLEMIRGVKGDDGYRECLSEIYRILKPKGIFGMGEPMHKDVEIPPEILLYITKGDMPAPWIDCFTTLNNTVNAFKSVGFNILEANYAPDAQLWWQEYAIYDPDPGDDAIVIKKDNNRWLSFGYIISKK